MLQQWRILRSKLGKGWGSTFVIVFLTWCAFALIPVQAAANDLRPHNCLNTLVHHDCRGNTDVQAVFWTMHKDGTQTLETRCIGDDSITGFKTYDMPAWHLNEGLSLFFQVPVYERQTGIGLYADVRTPV